MTKPMQPVFFQSICPVCGAAVPAAYMESGGAVYIEKTCPDHGPSRVLAAENAEDFARWAQSPSVTVAPRVPVTRGVRKTLWYGAERDAGEGKDMLAEAATTDAGIDGDAGGNNIKSDTEKRASRNKDYNYSNRNSNGNDNSSANDNSNNNSSANGYNYSNGNGYNYNYSNGNNESAGGSGDAKPAGAEVLNTECPYHCGVCDNHLMTACCVLLNVTTACNQHCPYCFANAGMPETWVENALGATGLFRPAGPDPRGQSRRFGGFHNGVHVPGGEYTDQNAASIPAVKVGSVDGVHIPGGGSAPVGASALGSGGDPAIEDIEQWLDALIRLGEERKFNIQLSGGEPTVRDDLPEIIRMCRDKGFEYVQLNTNGRRLAESAGYAEALRKAGLSTVFLQFDGMDDAIYETLRGEALLETKKLAVARCGAAGLPVTLVPTVLKNVNLSAVGGIVAFMLDNIRTVKGVHFQPASFFGRNPGERNAQGDFDERVTMFALMEEIEKQTGGRIPKSVLVPISTGHPLCCFCATFLKERDGGVTPLRQPEDGRSCGGEQPAGGASCCAPDPLEIIRKDRDFVLNKWETAGGAGADCGCGMDAAGAGAERGCGMDAADVGADCGMDAAGGNSMAGTDAAGTSNDGCRHAAPVDAGPMSFDEALLHIRNNLFTISGMAFMDATNLDAERLRRCRVQVFTKDQRLVPFCGYYALGKNA